MRLQRRVGVSLSEHDKKRVSERQNGVCKDLTMERAWYFTVSTTQMFVGIHIEQVGFI